VRHHTVIRNFFLKTSRRFFFQKSWPRGPIAPIRLPSIVPYSGARTSKNAQTILPERCRSKMARAISTHDLRTLKRRFRHVAARCARRGAARTRTFMRGVRAIRPTLFFDTLQKWRAAAAPRRGFAYKSAHARADGALKRRFKA
jgi:hypothetical protein